MNISGILRRTERVGMKAESNDGPRPRGITIREKIVDTVIDGDGQRKEVVDEIPEDQYELQRMAAVWLWRQSYPYRTPKGGISVGECSEILLSRSKAND